MKLPFSFAAAAMLAVAACPPSSIAKDAPHGMLLALSKADHVLAFVDPRTLKVTGRVPVGTDPHEVVASPDGKTAYVSIYGFGRFHEIDVIDLATQKAETAIDTKPLYGIHGLAFQDGKLWFTAEGAKAIGEYDPSGNALDWAMGTGQERTHMIYVTPDGLRIYTTNVGSGTVSILEKKKTQAAVPPGFATPGGIPLVGWTQTLVPVGAGSEGFDVSPDGKELWTAAAGDGAITVIDLDAKAVAHTIDAKAAGANRLKFTPDGKRVLVSSLTSGDLLVYDAATRTEIKRVNLGRGAAGILVDPDGSRAFIGCSTDNYVAVVDLKTLKVTAHIDVGGTPDGLAWAVTP